MQVKTSTGFLDQARDLGFFDNLLWIEPFLSRTFRIGQIVEVRYGGKEMLLGGKFTVRMVGKKYIWTDEAVSIQLGDSLVVRNEEAGRLSHQHDWHETDQWGTESCRICGIPKLNEWMPASRYTDRNDF
jgi:hypothetical protein